jgi:elongation factor P
MVVASQLRSGMGLKIEGQVYKVLEAAFKAGGGQLGGVVKAKLQNVKTGRLTEPHFRPDERLDDLELHRRPAEFLYIDGDNFVFMDTQSYEQFEVPAAVVRDAQRVLQTGMSIQLEFYEAQPISVIMPDSIEVRIADTAPPSRGQQDSTWKPAKLENGMTIMVPLFLSTGEVVRIDTQTAKYMERVKVKAAS